MNVACLVSDIYQLFAQKFPNMRIRSSQMLSPFRGVHLRYLTLVTIEPERIYLTATV